MILHTLVVVFIIAVLGIGAAMIAHLIVLFCEAFGPRKNTKTKTWTFHNSACSVDPETLQWKAEFKAGEIVIVCRQCHEKILHRFEEGQTNE